MRSAPAGRAHYAPFAPSKAWMIYKEAVRPRPDRCLAHGSAWPAGRHYGTLRGCAELLRLRASAGVTDDANAWSCTAKFGSLLMVEGDLPEGARRYEAGLAIAERLARSNQATAWGSANLSGQLQHALAMSSGRRASRAAARALRAGLGIAERLAALERAIASGSATCR